MNSYSQIDNSVFEGTRRTLPGIITKIGDLSESSKGERFNTPVEKGIVISEDKMISLEDKIKKKIEFYTAYPDLFLDEVLNPTESGFSLLFAQRLFMRAIMRFRRVHITAARGFSKTFTSILCLILKCIFQPGSVIAITAPTKKQATEIGQQKANEIFTRFPILGNEVRKNQNGNYYTGGRDNMTIVFKSGSRLEITAALESTRGRRFNGLLVDETRDQDGDAVNTILLPTLIISRRTVGKGLLNPKEPHSAQIYTTSASAKSSFNYQKLAEIFINSIVSPKTDIVLGIDYRVPVIEGLIDNNYIESMKLSPTFKEADFAREFLSRYTSDNEESWFNFDQLNRHRKMVKAEWTAKNVLKENEFYLMAVDVGRLHDQSVVTVFKVQDRKGKFFTKVVNIHVIGTTSEKRQFTEQVRDIKKIIANFAPREVVVDTNGLGIGLADLLIQEQIDNDGAILPAYSFNNDKSYQDIQSPSAPKILYSLKANQQLNSQMYSNCYSRIQSGLVDFLIEEREARSRLLGTKVGQKMSLFERTRLLLPYEMTGKLFAEMGNLRLKTRSGTNIVVLEKINSKFPKDKFSSLIMGLWRIKEIEEQQLKKRKRYGTGLQRNLMFYNEGRRGGFSGKKI